MNRRQLLALAGGASLSLAAQAPEPIIESHIHLFSGNFQKFPWHQNAWKPVVSPLEKYVEFAKKVGIIHSVHVSAEPYQNDHRYLAYTLEHAPTGFLKGTILLDTTLSDTPDRMTQYVKQYPGKIVALRIHCNREKNAPPTVDGPIRDRDLNHPGIEKAWRRAGELGIAIQAHFQYWFMDDLYRIASKFPDTRVIIDHFGHAGVGPAVKKDGGWAPTDAEWGYRDPKDFDGVLKLAQLPQTVLKVSALQYSSREKHPHHDIKPLARKAFDAFGPDRMMAGSLGSNEEAFREKQEVLNLNFDFLSSADRAKIRVGTAKKLFGFA